jgi:hypothetical protein
MPPLTFAPASAAIHSSRMQRARILLMSRSDIGATSACKQLNIPIFSTVTDIYPLEITRLLVSIRRLAS